MFFYLRLHLDLSILLKSNTKFDLSNTLENLESNWAFKDSNINIIHTTCLYVSRIEVRNRKDLKISEYVFINNDFTKYHLIYLLFFMYAKSFSCFCCQLAIYRVVILIIEHTLDTKVYIEKRFLYLI